LEQLGDLLHEGPALGGGRPADLEPVGQVLEHRHVGVERVALEDHGHVAVLGGERVHDLLAQPDLASGQLFESGDQPEHGRLAAARGTDEDEEFAVGDLEVQPVEGRVLCAAFVSVELGDFGEAKGGHGATC